MAHLALEVGTSVVTMACVEHTLSLYTDISRLLPSSLQCTRWYCNNSMSWQKMLSESSSYSSIAFMMLCSSRPCTKCERMSVLGARRIPTFEARGDPA